MEKEFLTYEDALTLKELGFNEPCFGHYLMKKFYLKEYHKQGEGITLRPLYSQAFRFFRDNYGLDGRVSNWNNESFYPKIKDVNTPRRFDDDTLRTLTEYKSHQPAEVACIKKLIELVKGLV